MKIVLSDFDNSRTRKQEETANYDRKHIYLGPNLGPIWYANWQFLNSSGTHSLRGKSVLAQVNFSSPKVFSSKFE